MLDQAHPDTDPDKDPDSVPGEFASEEDKEHWHKLLEAYKFLKEEKKRQLQIVPTPAKTELAELVGIIRDLVPTPTQNAVNESSIQQRAVEQTEQRLSERVTESIKEIKAEHRAPKVAASVVAGAVTTVWALPKTLSDNMALSQVLDVSNPIFVWVWLVVISIAGMVWLYYWTLERRQSSFRGYLATQPGQYRLFEEFLRYRYGMDGIESTSSSGVKGNVITRVAFVEFLRIRHTMLGHGYRSFLEYQRRPPPWAIMIPFGNRLYYERQRIDPELAQDVADVVFARALNAGFLERRVAKTLVDEYYIVGERPSTGY
jgi:hypothetical protein